VDLAGGIRYYGNTQPVDGVTVHLESPISATVQTDARGQFVFTGTSGGMWQVEPQKKGGAGTAISSMDAMYTLQAAVGLRSLSNNQETACDVTGNGAVTALDAALILQYKVGLIATFPVSEACDSDWAFAPVPIAVPHQRLSEPSSNHGSCQRGGIQIDPLVGSAAGQDFSAILFGDCNGNWEPNAASNSALSSGPIGQARVSAGELTRGRSRQLRLPVSVTTAQPFYTLDVVLDYDPAQLLAVDVRRNGPTRNALMSFNARLPGTLKIALVSPTPIAPQAGPVLIIQFVGSATARSAIRVQALVDDVRAPPSRSRR